MGGGVIAEQKDDIPIAKFLNYSPYHTSLLEKALLASHERFGEAKAEPAKFHLPNRRIVAEAARGKHINVFWGPAIENMTRRGLSRAASACRLGSSVGPCLDGLAKSGDSWRSTV